MPGEQSPVSYEDDIAIDEQALDVEWLTQSQKMMKYCKMAAEAQRALNLAKENVDFVYATVNRAVRNDPESYGVAAGSRGITEDSIKSAIQVHPEYQAATKEYIDAKYEAEVASGAVRAFDQRKSALENLVRLCGQNYFAGPQVPRDLADERRMRDAAVQERVGKSMRRRR